MKAWSERRRTKGEGGGEDGGGGVEGQFFFSSSLRKFSFASHVRLDRKRLLRKLILFVYSLLSMR